MRKYLKSALIASVIVFCIEGLLMIGGRLLAPPFLETLHNQKENQWSYIEIDTMSEPFGKKGDHLFYMVSDSHYMYVVESKHQLNLNDKLYGYSRPFDPYLKQLTIETLNTIAETQIVTPETFEDIVGVCYLDTTTQGSLILILTAVLVLILGLFYWL